MLGEVTRGEVMSLSYSPAALDSFSTFGECLRYLRRRARLTQLELSIAVDYSEAQISRLEQNHRLPDPAAVKALFVPALYLDDAPALAAQLIDLAQAARQEELPAPGPPPYKGLQPFAENDADHFFGREALVARLVERLDHTKFLAIVGASGSGKSSLLHAGLIPALKRTWPVRSAQLITPTDHPYYALASAVQRPRPDQKPKPGAPVAGFHLSNLVVIDQFEELFTLCQDEKERRDFVKALLSLTLDSPAVTTIIGLRADFYARCAPYAGLREQLANWQEYLGPLSSAELRQVIEEPARRGGWSFEPGLVDLLLAEVEGEPGALPLLSHALLETWQRRRGRALTLAGYRDSGGIRGAIAETAEAVFQDRLDAAQQDLVRRIFLRLVEPGDPAPDTRRRATLAELAALGSAAPGQPPVEKILEALSEARLITLGADTIELAHEALLASWPRLRRWLDEDRAGLRLHRHLTEAAQAWDLLRRDPGELYRGARLAQASEWADLHADELNALEREFIEAAQTRARRQEEEREAQRKRELEAARQLAAAEQARAEEQSRSASRLRGLAVGLALVLAVAVGAALWAARQTRRAEREARLATARELAAAAEANLPIDPERSALLALESLNVTYTREAEEALHRTLPDLRLLRTIQTGHETHISDLAYSPDGSRLVTASSDHTARILDATTGAELLVLRGHENWVSRVAYSPDGALIVTASDDGTARIWDASTGQTVRVLAGHQGNRSLDAADETAFVLDVAYSPDGRFIATASNDGTAKLWAAASGRELLTISGDDRIVASVAFSPDSSRLALVGDYNLARVVAVDSGETLLDLGGHPHLGNDVAFSPDGSQLVTVGNDALARVWNAASGEQIVSFRVGDSNSLAFSPDGTQLATVGIDGLAHTWEVATGRELLTLAGHTDRVWAARYSPDGERLATASSDLTVKIWSLQPGYEALTLHPFAEALVADIAISPDGSLLAGASTRGELGLWDIGTGIRRLTIAGHDDYVGGLAFSPDGTRLASASDDQTARVWDVKSGRLLLTLAAHKNWVNNVAFSPDGARIATIGYDKQAIIWDAATGQVLHRLPLTESGWGLAFSPDGTQLATGQLGGRITVWDVARGSAVQQLSQGDNADVDEVVFTPDGSRMITVGLDGTVTIWEANTGRETLAIKAHQSLIWGLAISPDGRTLATAAADQTAKLWDVATGERRLVLDGHSGALVSVEFSPDGRRLVTASFDGTVRSYVLPLDELTALARARLTRTWTEAECRQYLHQAACPEIEAPSLPQPTNYIFSK